MPFLDRIVNHINEQVEAGLGPKFNGSKIDGIALDHLVKEWDEESEKETQRWFPGILSDEGDIESLVIDDTHPIQIYHKVASAKGASSTRDGYGDQITYRDNYQMKIIVHGDAAALKMQVYDLEALLLSLIPNEINKTLRTELKLSQCMVSIGDRLFEPYRVWIEEYRNNTFDGLKPNSLFFRVNYQVSQEYTKACLDLCNC